MLAANVTLLVHSFGKSINYTCISKQPADMPHVINSYQLLLLILETKTEAINAYLTSNNKEGDKREKQGSKKKIHKQLECHKDWVESNRCNDAKTRCQMTCHCNGNATT